MAATRVVGAGAPIIPAIPHNTAPVILTARPLLSAHPSLAARIRAAGCELLVVGAWDRLLVGVEKAVVDIVLVDLDAVDRACASRMRMSGRRLVTLLARRLAEQARTRAHGARLAVLTWLDYVEIEDLVRLGVHILARPDHGADALLTRLCVGQAPNLPVTPGTAPVEARQAEQQASRLPETVWRHVAAVIADTAPTAEPRARAPRISDRAVMEGLCHMLRMGGGWAAYPANAGAPSTARRRLQRWRHQGVFARLAELALAGDVTLQELVALPWARLGAADGPTVPQRVYEAAYPCGQ